MKVSYRWLKALAPELRATPEELAERLAERGFPVEAREDLAEGLEGLVVGRVLRVREHPNADRLRLCDVDPGEGEAVQVVCGAPVIAQGGLYPFAPVGSTLPGGMELRKARIRGETSHGMLCSEKELGLGPDAGGIMELEGELEPGLPLAEGLGLNDVRLDVEVTPNRPDLLSHRGVAREVAPGGEAGVTLPDIPGEEPAAANDLDRVDTVVDSREASGEAVTVRIDAPERCGAYLGLVVRGVRVGPSPGWLQTRLRAAGARPINNVVDATNYVLLELGHPLHAFDLDRIQDRTIVVRRAHDGETIRTLDGEERTLTPEMLAICDAGRPVAVAGVMGGEDSEVDEATSDVLLECALFTPGPIRATRKALGLSTEASYRFERGVDPEGLREAILRAARVIQATAGGEVEGPIVEVRPEPFSRAEVTLRPSRVETVLGVPFSGAELAGLLEPLGFQVAGSPSENGEIEADGSGGAEHALRVQVPGFRSWDVSREVDLIEEVARTHGYDAFPDTLGAYRPGVVPDHPLFQLEDALRERLVAQGLLEAHTLAFASEGEVELLNPISAEEGYLRRWLLPALLARVEYNLARGNRDVRLFELGTVFRSGRDGELPRESTHLAWVLHGRRHPRHWSRADEAVEVWDLKGLLEEVVDTVAPGPWRVVPASEVPGDDGTLPASLVDDDVSLVVVDEDGRPVGRAGRIEAGRLDLPPWAGAVWGAEVALPPEPMASREVRYAPLSTHPSVDRDLALLVPRALPVARVLELMDREGGEHLADLQVFDLYEGEGVPEAKRSVAVRLRFQAPDRTLKDREVDARVDHLGRQLHQQMGVTIRGRND